MTLMELWAVIIHAVLVIRVRLMLWLVLPYCVAGAVWLLGVRDAI